MARELALRQSRALDFFIGNRVAFPWVRKLTFCAICVAYKIGTRQDVLRHPA
jgi:hypothetical protein